MESPIAASPVIGSFGGQSAASSHRSRSDTKLTDDAASLTSFNPFSEEDENDQSSYTLVTSIFSRMKNTLSAPRSSAIASTASSSTALNQVANGAPLVNEQRKPSYTAAQIQGSGFPVKGLTAERRYTIGTPLAQAAPPLVSLTPARPEVPTYSLEYDKSPTRGPFSYSAVDAADGTPFATSIPGFPIQDDARSIKTSTSLHRSGSVSKVIRRIRGEGKLHTLSPFVMLISS
jgi:1-phosphatidylinositol-3-phosphate 5-kinase